jgi:ABC-type bacteriocin/lantibiotic exporter with double-glycine peptidase domain
VLLGFENEMDLTEYKKILELTMLDDFNNPNESDLKMSGGEKQRVGMARALLTKPKLLILDEPTSALDSQTERSISELISKLKGQVTIVMVAHRLSTVRTADRVFYLKNGALAGGVSFQELRKIVPDFEKEVQLFEIPE